MKKTKDLSCLLVILLAGLLMCAVANAANQPGTMTNSSLSTAVAPSQAVTDVLGTTNKANVNTEKYQQVGLEPAATMWKPGCQHYALTPAMAGVKQKAQAPEAVNISNGDNPANLAKVILAVQVPISNARASAAPSDNGLTLACRGAPSYNSAKARRSPRTSADDNC